MAVGKVSTSFYISNRFVPSPELLKAKKLFDGATENVGNAEQVFLCWTSGDNFDVQLARRFVEKFNLPVKL